MNKFGVSATQHNIDRIQNDIFLTFLHVSIKQTACRILPKLVRNHVQGLASTYVLLTEQRCYARVGESKYNGMSPVVYTRSMKCDIAQVL